MTVGEIIKDARIRKGMTQEELAEKVGVKKSAVAKWENGRVSEIKRSNLKNLSDVLSIDPIQLLGEKVVTESKEKADTAVDIVIRLGDDARFCNVVKMINRLTPDQLSGVEKMLSGFFD